MHRFIPVRFRLLLGFWLLTLSGWASPEYAPGNYISFSSSKSEHQRRERATSFLLTAPSSLTLYGKAGGSGTGDGRSWANASGDLQATINASVAGGQVWVAQGTYKPTTSLDTSISFSMKTGVAIYGSFVGSETSPDQRPAFPDGLPTTKLSSRLGEYAVPYSEGLCLHFEVNTQLLIYNQIASHRLN